MTHHRMQEWPDMPGDGEDGDAIIFSTDMSAQDWDRHKSWYDAWQCLGGNAGTGPSAPGTPGTGGTGGLLFGQNGMTGLP